MHDVLDPRDTVPDELEQLLTSGYTVPAPLQPRIRQAADQSDRPALRLLLSELSATAVRTQAVVEPSSLSDILATMPAFAAQTTPSSPRSSDEIADKIHAAWLARCAGCCMGKPLEGLTPPQIRDYLRQADSWPLRTYIPLLDPLPAGIEKLNPSWKNATLNRVQEMPRDDDIDYTILALHIVETYGTSFTRENVAEQWLNKLPFTQTFTAERAVYRNIVSGVPVSEAATHENPYREWIGALIRGDFYGYISPGDPERAVRMAYADASLSHTANGVYGEMWAAALIACAFAAPTGQAALRESLGWVPAGSRLDDTLRHVISLHDDGKTWDEAIAWIDEHFAGHSWVHILNNAAAIAAGLLWGQDDIALSLGLTVQAGLDTDSATATVGSVLGAVHGTAALPEHLVAPLNDRIESAVHGFSSSKISDLAQRTYALAQV